MKLQRPQPHRVGIVIFDGCNVVDATGCAGVFASANDHRATDERTGVGYEISFLARRKGRVATSAGVSLFADHSCLDASLNVDTLVCAGGQGTQRACGETDTINAIRRMAAGATRVVSVCTGAFLLARAGLLDGRRAVTHWGSCEALARAHPHIRVEADPIFVRDGNVYTSAGVTAGMDLALALVEEDHGRGTALQVARDMVMFVKRPGSQAQFSAHLAAELGNDPTLRELKLWLLRNLGRDISVEQMAGRVAMSSRTFYRRFKQATGITPSRFLSDCRLDSARRLLEESPLPIKSVAARCGFHDSEQLRRGFHRRFGVSPDDYRRRF
ncbi:MAG: GlxA family transcriptional regulator [Pseudomonadota bacterium]